MTRDDFDAALMARVKVCGASWYLPEVRRRVFEEVYGEPIAERCVAAVGDTPDVYPLVWGTLYGLPNAKKPVGVLKWCE